MRLLVVHGCRKEPQARHQRHQVLPTKAYWWQLAVPNGINVSTTAVTFDKHLTTTIPCLPETYINFNYLLKFDAVNNVHYLIVPETMGLGPPPSPSIEALDGGAVPRGVAFCPPSSGKQQSIRLRPVNEQETNKSTEQSNDIVWTSISIYRIRFFGMSTISIDMEMNHDIMLP